MLVEFNINTFWSVYRGKYRLPFQGQTAYIFAIENSENFTYVYFSYDHLQNRVWTPTPSPLKTREKLIQNRYSIFSTQALLKFIFTKFQLLQTFQVFPKLWRCVILRRSIMTQFLKVTFWLSTNSRNTFRVLGTFSEEIWTILWNYSLFNFRFISPPNQLR